MSQIALIITGSIAAIKTAALIKALENEGYKISYQVTDTARQFIDESLFAELEPGIGSITNPIILVAPASADYISKLAHGEISLAGQIFIAPAMNFMMWQHPATQKNVRKLMTQGVKFLGPVLGEMACHDYGYGRFAEVEDIAAAVKNDQHPLHNVIDDALFQNSKIPLVVKNNVGKVLLVVHKNCSETIDIIKDLQSIGCQIKCVAAPEVDAGNFDVEVCTEHYQLNTNPPGMEHIRLPEWADVILMCATNATSLDEMSKGGAASLIGCVYLASKVPVFVISKSSLPILEGHGVKIVENYQQFKNLITK